MKKIFIFLVVAMLAVPVIAFADNTFTVNSVADDSDINQGDGVCLTASGVCTLRAAIEENNMSGGSTINFSADLVKPTIFLSKSLPDISKPITIEGSTTGKPEVTIDAQKTSRIFSVLCPQFINCGDFTTIFRGLIVKSGYDIFNSGGAFNIGISAIIERCSIIDNTAKSGAGISFTGKSLTIRDSTIANNTAVEDGGGISIYSNGITKIVNSTINNNSAVHGGGIHSGYGTVDLYNVTISGNTAENGGGGIHFWHNYNTNHFYNVSILNNVASKEGGAGLDINSSSKLEIKNTLVYNNKNLATGEEADCLGSIKLWDHSVMGKNSCEIAVTADPKVGPLADNGGLTATHAILDGSYLIDAGDFSSCNGDTAKDQRGLPRLFDKCDIGAYEYESVKTTEELVARMNSIYNDPTVLSNINLFPNTTFLLTSPYSVANATAFGVNSKVTINGNGSTLQRDISAPDFGIFFVESTGDLTLKDINIKNGRVKDTAGGAINNRGGKVTIARSSLIGNVAYKDKGSNTGGGAIYNNGGSLLIDKSFISDNHADGYFGGAISSDQSAKTTIANSTIVNNSAYTGGAISNIMESSLSMVNNTIWNNSTFKEKDAAAIFNHNSSMSIKNTIIANNNNYFNLPM